MATEHDILALAAANTVGPGRGQTALSPELRAIGQGLAGLYDRPPRWRTPGNLRHLEASDESALRGRGRLPMRAAPFSSRTA